jgi:hypothetical protein
MDEDQELLDDGNPDLRMAKFIKVYRDLTCAAPPIAERVLEMNVGRSLLVLRG